MISGSGRPWPGVVLILEEVGVALKIVTTNIDDSSFQLSSPFALVFTLTFVILPHLNEFVERVIFENVHLGLRFKLR